MGNNSSQVVPDYSSVETDYLKRMAESGNSWAQLEYGLRCLKTSDTSENKLDVYRYALEWFITSENNGNPKAGKYIDHCFKLTVLCA